MELEGHLLKSIIEIIQTWTKFRTLKNKLASVEWSIFRQKSCREKSIKDTVASCFGLVSMYLLSRYAKLTASNAVISILCLYLKKFKYEIKIWHDYRIQIAMQKYQRTDWCLRILSMVLETH